MNSLNFKITVLFLAIMHFLSASLCCEEAKRPDYKISPHDLIEISVYPQKDLNAELNVDSNGFIFFSFLGHVEVAGLTAEEAALKLTKLLEIDYLVEPRVIVHVKESKKNVVILIGEVREPGTYNYKLAGMTLMEAISDAGGFSEIAWMNGTKIIRSIDGEEKTLKIKISNILNGKEKDLLLEPGDIIVVPESIF